MHLREGDNVLYVIGLAKQHNQSVQTECKSAVRRRTVVERADKEAEALFYLFVGKAEHVKHFLLNLARVNSDTAAACFLTVDNEVVGFCANLKRLGVEKR